MKPRLQTEYFVEELDPDTGWTSAYSSFKRKEALNFLHRRRKLHAGLKPHQRAMWRLLRVSTVVIITVLDPKP